MKRFDHLRFPFAIAAVQLRAALPSGSLYYFWNEDLFFVAGQKAHEQPSFPSVFKHVIMHCLFAY